MRRRPALRLGFLASGNGSSLRAIVAAIEAGELAADPRLLVTNRRTCGALRFARDHGLAARVLPTLADPAAADEALAGVLVEAGVELVILSGYLRKLGPRTLARFAGRILNVHPALLPAFGGEGMYGRRVHEAVHAAGVSVTGASIHLVDGWYDHGQVIARAEAPVAPGDDAAAIEAKVMAIELGLFVTTLKAISEGTLALPALD